METQEENPHTINNLLTCQGVQLNVNKRQEDSSYAVATILTRQISILDAKDEEMSTDIATDLLIHRSATTSTVGNCESHIDQNTSNKRVINKPTQMPLDTCNLLPNTTKLTDHYIDIPSRISVRHKTITADHTFETEASNNKRNCASEQKGDFRQSRLEYWLEVNRSKLKAKTCRTKRD